MTTSTAPSPTSAQSIATLCFLGIALCAAADDRVAVVAWASEEYAARKLAESPPRVETYVFMQGRRFESFTRDDSLTRRSFLDIAKTLSVELARGDYRPAPDVESADLLLLVHWGTTTPRVSLDSLRGRVSIGIPQEVPHAPGEVFENHPENDIASEFFVDDTEKYREFAFEQAERVADGLKDDLINASNANLLGYTAMLRRLGRMPIQSTAEHTMRNDLQTERYFIIVKAYDLKAAQVQGGRGKLVWTLHLNMRSPGQNFRMAVGRMSNVAVNFAGRNTTELTTVRPTERTGVVTLGPLKVIGTVE